MNDQPRFLKCSVRDPKYVLQQMMFLGGQVNLNKRMFSWNAFGLGFQLYLTMKYDMLVVSVVLRFV